MTKRILSSVLSAAVLALAIACTQGPTNQVSKTNEPAPGAAIPAELKPALDSINTNDILQHTKVLSADEYEGRAIDEGQISIRVTNVAKRTHELVTQSDLNRRVPGYLETVLHESIRVPLPQLHLGNARLPLLHRRQSQ